MLLLLLRCCKPSRLVCSESAADAASDTAAAAAAAAAAVADAGASASAASARMQLLVTPESCIAPRATKSCLRSAPESISEDDCFDDLNALVAWDCS